MVQLPAQKASKYFYTQLTSCHSFQIVYNTVNKYKKYKKGNTHKKKEKQGVGGTGPLPRAPPCSLITHRCLALHFLTPPAHAFSPEQKQRTKQYQPDTINNFLLDGLSQDCLLLPVLNLTRMSNFHSLSVIWNQPQHLTVCSRDRALDRNLPSSNLDPTTV